MTHLIAVRTVSDVDGKPFQVADVIEDTATLPHSILLYEYFDPQWECRAEFLANMVDVVNSTELDGCGNDSDLYDWARGG